MADITERLRDVLRNWTNVTDDEQTVIRDAADEIDRLRAALQTIADTREESAVLIRGTASGFLMDQGDAVGEPSQP
jgi:hypothetical protein